MKIFETDRLTIKSLKQVNKLFFIELLSNPKIIDPIPQPQLSHEKIINKFNQNLNFNGEILKNEENIFGVFEKNKTEMIGLCAILTNNENDWEIAYRFRTEYWRKGYGTETTKGIIEFCFKKLNIEKLTADVNIENKNSLKIVNKFMKPASEFFNENDNCIDRRYQIEKN